MKHYKLIIFDWDGTLFRSIELIEKSIVAAARANGAVVSETVARSIIGLGLKAAQKQLFPDWAERSADFYAAFNRSYREFYEAGEADLTLYEGAFDLVQGLHGSGKIIAVATAKSRAGIDRSLAVTGLARFVSHSRTPEECRPKPDPHMILEILEATGVTASDAVMIGDTTHDLKMAKNAGVASIGLTHGAHPRSILQTEPNLAILDNLLGLHQTLM